MTTLTPVEFEAKIAKVIASYAKDPRIEKALKAEWAVIRHADDLWAAAGENASQDCEMNTTEYVEMFEASIEGILSDAR